MCKLCIIYIGPPHEEGAIANFQITTSIKKSDAGFLKGRLTGFLVLRRNGETVGEIN